MKKLLEVIHEDPKDFIIESVKMLVLAAWFFALYVAIVCIVT